MPHAALYVSGLSLSPVLKRSEKSFNAACSIVCVGTKQNAVVIREDARFNAARGIVCVDTSSIIAHALFFFNDVFGAFVQQPLSFHSSYKTKNIFLYYVK